MCQEGTEALSGRTLELDVQRVFGQSGIAIAFGDLAREHRTYRTIGVGDRIVERYLVLFLDSQLGMADNIYIFDVVDRMDLSALLVNSLCLRLCGEVGQAAEV